MTRKGTKGFVSIPLETRFWAKVIKGGDDECWEWSGTKGARGYAIIYVNGKLKRASRVAWELANGQPFPEGRDACHHCDNPPCVNPRHIWPGTKSENALDALRKNRLYNPQSVKTHCPYGHPYIESNIYLNQGKRNCRQCKPRYMREYKARKAQAALDTREGT